MQQPEVSRFQKFVIERWQRSQIKEHPQNPRRISDAAKKKLKSSLTDVGLIDTLIVNRRTGYLLGGHQRLSQLDSLERYKPGKNDYALDVAVVDLDEKTELKALVLLNNPSAQGQWDTDILAELGQSVSFDDMGFDRIDVEMMFNGDPRVDVESIFKDTPEQEETKGALETIKAERAEMKERKQAEQSADHYLTVICKDQAEKEKLMKHLGIPKGELYISPAEIFALKR